MRALLAMAALFAFCVAAQSQQPSPTPTKSGNQKQGGTAQTAQQPAEQQSSTAKSPLFVELANTQKSADIAKTEAQKEEERSSNERWLTSWTGVLAIFTVALVIVAAIQAGFFWYQLRLMRQGVTDATIAARAAEKTAIAAELQAKTSTEALHRANRPWVGLFGSLQTVVPLTFNDVGARSEIKFKIKNAGNSPAIDTAPLLIFSVGPARGDPRQYVSGIPREFFHAPIGIPLLPGDMREWPVSLIEAPRHQFSLAPSGNVSVWLSGYFGYKDEFGSNHTSHFLFRYTTVDQRIDFPPVGVVAGHFEIIPIGWQCT